MRENDANVEIHVEVASPHLSGVMNSDVVCRNPHLMWVLPLLVASIALYSSASQSALWAELCHKPRHNEKGLRGDHHRSHGYREERPFPQSLPSKRWH